MKQSTIHASIERARADDGPPILKLLSAAALPVDGLLDHLDTNHPGRFLTLEF